AASKVSMPEIDELSKRTSSKVSSKRPFKRFSTMDRGKKEAEKFVKNLKGKITLEGYVIGIAIALLYESFKFTSYPSSCSLNSENQAMDFAFRTLMFSSAIFLVFVVHGAFSLLSQA